MLFSFALALILKNYTNISAIIHIKNPIINGKETIFIAGKGRKILKH